MQPQSIAIFLIAVLVWERWAVVSIRSKCRPLYQRHFNVEQESATDVGRTAYCTVDSRLQCSWRAIRHAFLDTFSYQGEECCLYYRRVGSDWDDANATDRAMINTFSRIEQNECSDGFIRLGKSCYKFHMIAKSWDAARADCQALGSDLFVFNSPDEVLVLQAYIAEHHPTGISLNQLYVGLRAIDGTKTFVDVTDGNTIPDYLPWHANQPDGPTDNECVSTFVGAFTLNDLRCSTNLFSVCEETP